MPCALPASIMSTEYAQEGNQRGSSLSTTNEDEMSDDQAKAPSMPTPSSRVLPPTGNSKLAMPPRPNHSFSIDALVGNTRSSESTKVEPESCAESWQQHHLIDLKRIQAYYQQLYSANSPLKQLNTYLYPHLNGVVDTGALAKAGDSRQQDLLAYYANLYLQSSSFYQERYFSADTFLGQNCPKEKAAKDEIVERSIANENESKDSSHSSPKDSFQIADRYHDQEQNGSKLFFNNTLPPKEKSPASPAMQPTPASMYSEAEKEADLGSSSHSALRASNFPQHLFGSQPVVSSSLNSSSFYPSYCDYDLLINGGKSNLLLGGSSAGTATPNSIHSPLAPGADSKQGPSSGASNPAAAAAYHLSNMFRKPKRIRTAFSPGQLLRLEEIFEKNRYVVGCERRQLARDLNLSETQIKVWFQNRRTKHKREKHVGVGPSGHSSTQQSDTTNFHSGEMEKPVPCSARSPPVSSTLSFSTASSLPSSTSVSNAGYLSNGNFAMTSSPSSAMYGSHFKGQANAHRTLLAK